MRIQAPLWAYREPPNGLTAEWQRAYLALVDPVTVVATFCDQSDAARRAARELLAAWHDRLRRSEDGMNAVLGYLHASSPRTWRAGHAIRKAVSPITASLASAVRFLTQPHPTRAGPEATAIALREGIADRLGAFDARSLLDELAAAVVEDCARQQRAAAGAERTAIEAAPTVGGYVDLDQIAAVVNRSKSTMEKLKRRKPNPLPDPDVPGGGGKKDEWLWSHIRPWLEGEFKRHFHETVPRRL